MSDKAKPKKLPNFKLLHEQEEQRVERFKTASMHKLHGRTG